MHIYKSHKGLGYTTFLFLSCVILLVLFLVQGCTHWQYLQTDDAYYKYECKRMTVQRWNVHGGLNGHWMQPGIGVYNYNTFINLCAEQEAKKILGGK